MYILPVLLKQTLLEVFAFKGLIMLGILFAVMAATTLALQIFRTPIEDGTDILVLSKPLTRTTVLWTKVFVEIIWILIIATGLTVIASFTLIGANDTSSAASAKAVILGSFLGTIVIFMVWGSMATFFTIFFKKIVVFLVAVGIESILIVIGMVCSMAINDPASLLKTKNNIEFNAVCLLSKPNKDQQINYQWGAIGLENNQPITEKTIWNGDTLEAQMVPVTHALNYLWDQQANKSNQKTLQAIDLEYQLASMVNVYTSQMLQEISIAGNACQKGPLDDIFNQKLFGIAWDLQFNNLGFTQIQKNLNASQIKFSNQDWSLMMNATLSFKNVQNPNWNYKSSHLSAPDVSGTLKNAVKPFPVSLLTAQITNNGLKTLEITTPSQFVDVYLHSQTNNINQFKQAVPNSNILSYYSSLYLANLMTQNHLTTQDFTNPGKINPQLINTFSDQINELSYLSYLTLEDYFSNPNTNLSLNTQDITQLLGLLNLSENTYQLSYTNSVPMFVGNLNDLQQCHQYLNKPNYWYLYNAQLNLIPNHSLQTFSIVHLSNTYNFWILLLTWFGFSLVMFAVAVSLYSKRDFA